MSAINDGMRGRFANDMGRKTWICGTFSSYTRTAGEEKAEMIDVLFLPWNWLVYHPSSAFLFRKFAKNLFPRFQASFFCFPKGGRDVANFCAASLPFPRKNTGARRNSFSRGLQSRFSRNNSCLASSASDSRRRSMVLPLPSTYEESCCHVTNQTALAKKVAWSSEILSLGKKGTYVIFPEIK